MQSKRNQNKSYPLGEILDCITLLVKCTSDNVTKFGLQYHNELKGLWLPYKSANSSDSWLSTAENLAGQLNVNVKVLGILQISRFQPFSHSAYANRISFLAEAPSDPYKEESPLQWFSLDELSALCKLGPDSCLLAGSEPLDLARLLESSSGDGPCPLTSLQEVKASALLHFGLKQSSPAKAMAKSQLEQLLESAKFGEKEQQELFHVFVHHCLPCERLSYPLFCDLMQFFQWSNKASLPHVFRALSEQVGARFLSFRDLLKGLAAMEPSTQHGGPPAELRCRYIFLFYSRTFNGKMTYSDFMNLTKDIHLSKGIAVDDHSLEESARTRAELFNEDFGTLENVCLPLNDFLQAVGQLKFRGTSLLFRSPVSVVAQLHKIRCINGDHQGEMLNKASRRLLDHPTSPRIAHCRSNKAFIFNTENEADRPPNVVLEPSVGVRSPYELASHAVKVRRSGTLVNVFNIKDSRGQHSLSKEEARVHRFPSTDAFNQSTHANKMLSGLRYFERPIYEESETGGPPMQHKEALSWDQVNMADFAQCLITLCGQVREVTAEEPRLVHLTSPTYILGDLHGNFSDLVCFEKALWRMGPLLTPASILFLGDYVDRGKHGIEVVAHLFAQKMLAPDKFILLRGNHELRQIQKGFSFYKECLQKFGNQIGELVWEAINQVFDVMPLAAVIDNKIFCVHGGIPPPNIGGGMLSSINDIPKPLADPHTVSSLAWEIMWNDPLGDVSALSSESLQKLEENKGFLENVNRGTGHVFSAEALEAFLNRNGLSHVVRAHEVKPDGFQVQLHGKLLTVFSSSHYCGESNEAACVLADRSKLRTIRLDTS